MNWKLSTGEDGVAVWERSVGDIRLAVSRSKDRHGLWTWQLRYGIVFVMGYSSTLRGAKMRATKTANEYATQLVITGE